ncbi:extracellular solute-binding protein (family 3) [Primorskyibacter sedentarius]|uniref:Extracellular solute-binding protein (Family 3) n=1 Tax=Primorskyibacter sedentarius TaxID=745311 RepID=A0A4R3J745_9RHOB|nr:transporter substrate-binding domain-containing protein [Primorskyibacter sedentarius]TCS60280.1 extracellular solute-binding protein (family 3) [Primorskyibacter sedentarius]
MPLRFLICSIMLASAPVVLAQSIGSTEGPTITIGARVDARPFIWRDKDTGGYLGFLWDICTDAVTRAGYKFEAKKVNADARKKFLETGDGAFDLLCDPTTITLSRMKEFIALDAEPSLRFSPIVFVANGSYVKTTHPARSAMGFGQFGGKIANCADAIAAEEKLLKPKNDEKQSFFKSVSSKIPIQMFPDKPLPAPEKKYEIWGFVEGSTSEAAVRRGVKNSTADLKICPKPLKTHAEAAKDFCAGRIALYYGDVEIVRAAIEDVAAVSGVECKADFKPTAQGSYEPYAFVVSSRNFRRLPDEFDHALYGMFSDGTVDRLFVGHFSEKTKSQFLNTLFRINRLPAGTPRLQP